MSRPRGSLEASASSSTDNTDHKLTAAQLQQLCDAIACGVLVRDKSGRITHANRAAAAIIGLPREQIVGSADYWPPLEILDDDGRRLGADVDPVQRVIRTGIAARNATYRLQRPDREPCWFQVDAVPISGSDGTPDQIVVTLVDVTERKRVEEVAREATERWQRLVDDMGDAAVMADLNGNTVLWNKAAARMFGWTAEEVLGKPAPFVPADNVDESRQRFNYVISSGETVIYESVLLTKDGGRVPTLVTVSPLLARAEGVIGTLGVHKDISVREQLDEQARTLAVLEERERIAMDLHDGVIQSLYGLSLSLRSPEAASASERRDVLRSAGSQIDAIVQGIRNYIFGLRPHELGKRGIHVGLITLAEELRVNALIKSQLRVTPGVERLLDANITLDLLLIAREAISNVIRHSRARTTSIELTEQKGRVLLTVRDDGVGFETKEAGRRKGDGLGNMQERAASIGARLRVRSRPGHGTVVRLELPLSDQAGFPPESGVRLLLVDDHEVVRRGLRTVFDGEADIEVVGDVGTATEAVAEVVKLQPNVVLMDVRLPDRSGIEACRDILSRYPDSRIIMLTAYADRDAILASVLAGASGFLLKQSDTNGLIEAVRAVARGASLLDSTITATVLDLIRHQVRSDKRSVALSRHEQDILALIAEGRTNRQIAAALSLSEHTIRTYVSKIFHKLNFTRRSEAAAFAAREASHVSSRVR